MKRKKLWLSLLLVVALLAAWFEPTRCVRGVLAGEPFHQGRPASWWAVEWEQWCVTSCWRGNTVTIFPEPDELASNPSDELAFAKVVQMPLWDRFRDYCQQSVQGRKTPPRPIEVEANSALLAPPLLSGDDPSALSVLQALEHHASPKVRVFARYGIKRLHDARQQPAD